MYGYIYKLTNILNGKIYIGKHKYNKNGFDPSYLTSGILIQQAIDKYGIEYFTQEYVCKCDSLEDLNAKEIAYIEKYKCMNPDGYNLTPGGDGLSDPPLEIRKKMAFWSGKKQSEYTKLKRNASLRNVKHTDEWIEKIRLSNTGKIPSKQTIDASKERHIGSHWYNDGVNEYMLKDDADTRGLTRGRLKNPFSK